MNQLLNAMRMQAMRAQSQTFTTKVGTVSSYDPGAYAVKVILQPNESETGWLPLASPWVGNGWGMFCPPRQGDMVEVSFVEGSNEAGIACLRLYSDEDRPLPCPSGELWFVHASGAYFKLTNDGKASFSDGHGATVSLNGDGSITSAASMWTHSGPMAITGDVAIDGNAMITGTELVGGAITGAGGLAVSASGGGAAATVSGTLHISGGDVTADAYSLKSHRHNTGGGTTGPAIP